MSADLEFSNFYCKRYSYYIDGELDAVYSQYWWDGIMLSDSLLYGRTTTSLYVDSGITVDLDDWEQRVIDSCVFSILTDIHNYLY